MRKEEKVVSFRIAGRYAAKLQEIADSVTGFSATKADVVEAILLAYFNANHEWLEIARELVRLKELGELE